MNKVIIPVALACGLLLLNIPEAAAHEKGHGHKKKQYSYAGVYSYEPYRSVRYAYAPQRSSKMPKWLKRDKAFRNWFEHSHLRRDRQVSWSQLADIYRWERSLYRSHYRSHYRSQSRSHYGDRRR